MSELRERLVAYLLAHRMCIISTSGSVGAWAMPTWYRPVATTPRSQVLDVECLLPRWADASYHLEQNPRVLLVIVAWAPNRSRGPLCWLQYRGVARPVATPDWTDLLPDGMSPALAPDLYLVVHVTPERIDLVDETGGWGARETLEMGDAHDPFP